MCDFICKNGIKCKNNKLNYSNFCHIISHYPSKEMYNLVAQNITSNFISQRIPMNLIDLFEISADGACLFRSLSSGLFYHCQKNLINLIDLFKKTKYLDNENFLNDYLDIAECLESNDYILDTDLEENIAKQLQKTILNFIKNNEKLDISHIINNKLTLDELLFICHEIPFNTYIKHYERFAGDDDFIVKEVIGELGEVNEEKEEIEDRWGSILEIIVFCIIFKINVKIFSPQKLDKKTLKPINISNLKINNIYLKEIDFVNCGEMNEEMWLLHRNTDKYSHYDFIRKKSI